MKGVLWIFFNITFCVMIWDLRKNGLFCYSFVTRLFLMYKGDRVGLGLMGCYLFVTLLFVFACLLTAQPLCIKGWTVMCDEFCFVFLLIREYYFDIDISFLIVLKSFIACKPILLIFFKLIELVPPCLGRKVIGLNKTSSLLSNNKTVSMTFDKLKCAGIFG